MKDSEISAISARHLMLWQTSDPKKEGKYLQQRIEDAIKEALSEDDTIWIPLAKHFEVVKPLETQLAAMTRARDDAVEAVKIACEQHNAHA